MAETITVSNLRAMLKTVLDNVCDDRKPLIVLRERGEDVVIMSREEWEGWQETVHLLKSPANAEWLKESIAQAKQGKIIKRELIGTDQKWNSHSRRTVGKTTKAGSKTKKRSTG